MSLNVLAQSTSFEIVEEMGRGINLGQYMKNILTKLKMKALAT